MRSPRAPPPAPGPSGRGHPSSEGRIAIADLAFPGRVEREAARAALGAAFDPDEDAPLLAACGLPAVYRPVTPFSGAWALAPLRRGQAVYFGKMKRLLLAALLALPAYALLTDPAEIARVRVVAAATPAVVRVQGQASYSENAEPVWGSGFFYAPHRVLTNFHVIDGLEKITVSLENGEQYPAKVFAVDKGLDLAILETEASAPATLAFAQDPPRPGQTAILISSPYGRLNLVSLGVVSGVGPFEDAAQLGSEVGIEIFEVVYTDAHVAPGSSGGPLLDGQGKVIGVVDAVLGGPSGLSGIGMAIPARLARQSIQDLEKYGLPQRGWLGVTLIDLTDLDPLLLKALGLYGERGAMIDRVEPGSPAAQAGLRGAERDQLGKLVSLGDVILAVNGKPVKNRFEVIQAIARHRPGDRVTLTLWRNGRRVEVEVALTVRR